MRSVVFPYGLVVFPVSAAGRGIHSVGGAATRPPKSDRTEDDMNSRHIFAIIIGLFLVTALPAGNAGAAALSALETWAPPGVAAGSGHRSVPPAVG